MLVQFEPDVAEDARAIARAAASAVLARTLRADGRLERLTTSLPVSDAIAILQALPQVELAEPNWIVRQDATANDPFFTNGSMWGIYGNTTTPASEFGSQAGEAWARDVIGSADVYVAIIDDGIDFTHPDLAPNIWTNPFDPIDSMDNDGNGYVDDIHGWDFAGDDNSIFDSTLDDHGTHVAGTIGARGGNGIGVAGVNWNVTIIGGKFIGPTTGDIAHAVEALDYITDLKTRHGLNIVATNNSWGGSQASTFLHDAIIRAAKQGILFVTSAGNAGSNNDSVPHYPSNYSTLVDVGSETAASYEAVIAVAALASDGSRPSFSNYGAATVDIGAPGSGIYSTTPGNTYSPFDGTSMAAPHVTGSVALYKAAHPAASAAEIRSAILLQGIDTPSMSGITTTGRRLNVGDFRSDLRVTIDDVRLTEGNVGTRNATFTVTMTAASGSPVAVTYETRNGTALNGVAAEANTGALAVPASGTSGNASPYPSTITMPAGLGTVTNVQVVLTGLSHQFVPDVDVLLVGPAGQTCVLMSDVGSGAATNLMITFDDSGAALPIGSPLSSGTYRPTNNGFGDFFGSPAPPGPHGSTLSMFNGTSAAGTWRLFAIDDSALGIGGIAGGWSLALTTSGADYSHTAGALTFPAGSISQQASVPVIGDAAFEPAEHFVLALTSALGATVDDDEGQATIVNDDFTDAVLSGQPIRAIHLIELRSAINELRTTRGLAPFAFTDTLTPHSTAVRAIHVTELRQALDAVYVAAGLMPPVYTDQVVIPGVTVVRVVHIAEIRDRVISFP